jgi:hypothetical protein
MATTKATWQVSIDRNTAHLKLVIQYHSQLPEFEHSQTHKRIVEEAKEALSLCGLNPDYIKDIRVECQFVSESLEETAQNSESEVQTN